jgi:hypothetical protein
MLRRRKVLKHTFRFGHPSLPTYLPSTLIYSFFLYAPVASQARAPPYPARCALAHLAGVHATTIFLGLGFEPLERNWIKLDYTG